MLQSMDVGSYEDNQLGRQFLKYFCLQKEAPTLPFLARLTRAFCAIPYENATKRLKVLKGFEGDKRLRLPEEVLEDYLRYGAGGTCFSLTFFFHTILKNLGFESYPVMGDRSYGANTHCALIVCLDGKKLLVDPGFLVDRPMPLNPLQDTVLWTPFNTVHLVHDVHSPDYDFYTVHQGNKKWRYRLKVTPVSWDDFHRFWSDSFGLSGLNSVVITAVRDGQQIYFRNNHLRIVTHDRIVRRTVENPADLQEIFGIRPSLLRQAMETGGTTVALTHSPPMV